MVEHVAAEELTEQGFAVVGGGQQEPGELTLGKKDDSLELRGVEPDEVFARVRHSAGLGGERLGATVGDAFEVSLGGVGHHAIATLGRPKLLGGPCDHVALAAALEGERDPGLGCGRGVIALDAP